jgi:oxalate decarboxylase/phosphoglucose isomerase-like protein (cupin superfamily)
MASTPEGNGRIDPDLNKFPYERFMEREGIPVHSAPIGIPDVTALPRAPWARTGGNGCFIQLDGLFESERGVYVADVPATGQLLPVKHLYEEEVFVLSGLGTAEVWQDDGPRLSFEVQQGSVFVVPPNASHVLYNVSGSEPLVYMGANTAPRVINALFDDSVVFSSDHRFVDLAAAGPDYFKAATKSVFGWYKEGTLDTRLIPDSRRLALDDHERKVAGGQLTGYRMGPRFPRGHISSWPVGVYHKAHYHGPGAILLGLDGEGYVRTWPASLGARPTQAGHDDEVITVEWGRNSIYVPPNAYFHQHFNTGAVPARHVAVYGETLPLGVHNLHEKNGWRGYRSYRDGGTLIEYEDEDPAVRREFEERLAARGLAPAMPAVVYGD